MLAYYTHHRGLTAFPLTHSSPWTLLAMNTKGWMITAFLTSFSGMSLKVPHGPFPAMCLEELVVHAHPNDSQCPPPASMIMWCWQTLSRGLQTSQRRFKTLTEEMAYKTLLFTTFRKLYLKGCLRSQPLDFWTMPLTMTCWGLKGNTCCYVCGKRFRAFTHQI